MISVKSFTGWIVALHAGTLTAFARFAAFFGCITASAASTSASSTTTFTAGTATFSAASGRRRVVGGIGFSGDCGLSFCLPVIENCGEFTELLRVGFGHI
jgi:hypothetical protein